MVKADSAEGSVIGGYVNRNSLQLASGQTQCCEGYNMGQIINITNQHTVS
jgi:hypothetical protein